MKLLMKALLAFVLVFSTFAPSLQTVSANIGLYKHKKGCLKINMVPVDWTLEKECALHRYFLYTRLSIEIGRTRDNNDKTTTDTKTD